VPSGQQLRRRRMGAGLGVLAAMVVLTVAAPAHASGIQLSPLPTQPPTPPALPPPGPPQSGPGTESSAPPAGCSFAPLGPQEVRTVDDHPQLDPSTATWWNPPSWVIDPANPCHMYMLATEQGSQQYVWGYPQVYPYTVMRGDAQSHGTTWSQAYVATPQTEDDVANPATGTAQLFLSPQSASLAVGAPGSIWLADTPRDPLNETRLFTSAAGQHWHESDAGLLVQDPSGQQGMLLFAPSNPQQGYLVREGTDPSASPNLAVTGDGGLTWQPRAVPAYGGSNPAVAVDPSDPERLFVASTGDLSTVTIWESDDAGLTWSAHLTSVPLPSPPSPRKLLVAHPRGGLVLYLQNSHSWFESRDTGATWTALPVPAVGGCGFGCFADLAVDPADPDVAVWIGTTCSTVAADLTCRVPSVSIAATHDDFGGGPLRTLTITTPADSPFAGGALRVDAAGDFFLLADTARQSSGRDRILAFRVTALTGATVSLATPPPPPPPTTTPPRTPSGSSFPAESPIAVCPTSAGNGGSVAFDGHYVDYSEDSAAPGIIFRITPSCVPAPPLRLNPASFPGGKVPPVYSLTYDSRFQLPSGRTGAILAGGGCLYDSRVDRTDLPIYAVDPVSGDSTIAAVIHPRVACTAVFGYPASVFSYDVFRDQVLVPSLIDGVYEWLNLRDGTSTPDNCLGTVYPRNSAAVEGSGQGVAAAVVGGDGVLYVEDEDDQTLYRLDEHPCRIVSGITHPFAGENADEDEQVACDSLSFSRPVIWSRNDVSNGLEAYPAPDAYCPFPTHLTYSQPAVVQAGAAVDLCFSLTGNTNGQTKPLAGMSVAVQLGSRAVGASPTSPSGLACVWTTAPPRGGVFAVHGTFGGTHAYLPSGADGVLVVAPPPVPLPPATVAGLGLIVNNAPPDQPNPQDQINPQIGPAGQPEAQAQAQAQAEAQAQAQSQSQAHTVAQAQPGLMVQRQQRTQVASQQQGVEQQVSYRAVRLRQSRVAPLSAFAVGVLMLGLGLTARRPAVARARYRRDRRR
jgi:hypothetical protein